MKYKNLHTFVQTSLLSAVIWMMDGSISIVTSGLLSSFPSPHLWQGMATALDGSHWLWTLFTGMNE